MVYNTFNILLIIIITTLQIFIPIAEEGRTYYSYFIPWLLIVFRGCFVLKTFGFPIHMKVPLLGEIGVYFFSMFIFLSAFYKKRFDVYTFGIIINVICVIIIISSILIEDTIFIYEHRKKEDIS